LIKGRGSARVIGDPCGMPIGFFKVQIAAKESQRGEEEEGSMPHSYNGKILRVDLTTKKVKVEELGEIVYRTYLGGEAWRPIFFSGI
jgi:hypothetical protein